MLKKLKIIVVTALCTVFLTLGIEVLFFGENLTSLVKINNILKLMTDKFYFDYDADKALDYAVTGLTLAADDKYTNYYNSDKFKTYMLNGQNTYLGIGVVLGADENGLEIYSVSENSPAEKAGLLKDDIILEINGEKMTSESVRLAADKIRESKGSIELVIQRNNESINIFLEKASIEKHTVSSKIIDDNIGYIKISSFDRKDDADKNSVDTYDEFTNEARELKNSGCDKLVIDLRDNPGGDVNVVSNIADYLLPKCVITYIEDKKGRKKYHYSDERYEDFEIVLLVNQNSASASELLAGALKDNGKAEIVGEKTYGKGIVQNIYSFSDGSGISITTARYYTPNGECIHQVGIEPDYYVNQSYDDAQLDKAIELLKIK